MWQSILLIVSIFAIYSLSFMIIKKDRQLVFLSLSFLIISLYLVLQKSIGADYYNYEKIYDTIAAASWDKVFKIHLSVEPLYRLICKLSTILGMNYELFVRLYLVVALAICFYSFNRDCKNGLLNVIVFIAFSFSWTLAYRQFMAFAITLWAFKFVKNKKFFLYLLSILIAMTLHITALVAIVIYPIYNNEKYVNIYRCAIILLILSMFIFNSQIINFCINLFSRIDPRHAKYFTNKEFSINMTLLMTFLVLILVLFLDRKNVFDNKAINILLLCLFGYATSAITNMTARFMLFFNFLIGYGYDRLFDFERKDLVYSKETKLNSNIFITTNKQNRAFVFSVFLLGLILFWWYTDLREFNYIPIFS